MPKFLVFVFANATPETGTLPPAEEFSEMTVFNEQLEQIGALVAAEGLLPSSKGVRIGFTTDGPTKPEHRPFGLENLVLGTGSGSWTQLSMRLSGRTRSLSRRVV